MSKLRLVALTAAAVAFGVGTASAIEIDGKKGIGFAQAIGGPAGLAFNYGTGNLQIEAILGVHMAMPDSGDGVNTIGFAAGAHFHALRAENASLSFGGRLNLGLGKPAGEDVTQFGFDIPVRVYWFPDRHISVHAEMGISIIMNPEKGNVFPGGAGPKGMDVVIFGGGPNAGAFGNIGLTFWW